MVRLSEVYREGEIIDMVSHYLSDLGPGRRGSLPVPGREGLDDGWCYLIKGGENALFTVPTVENVPTLPPPTGSGSALLTPGAGEGKEAWLVILLMFTKI